MSQFRILGNVVTAEKWQDFVALLDSVGTLWDARVDPTAVRRLTADGNFSRADLLALFDDNQDGRLTFADLWIYPQFARFGEFGIDPRSLLGDRLGEGKFTREYYRLALLRHPELLPALPEALRNDPEFLLDCFGSSVKMATAAAYIPASLQTPEFLQRLIEVNPWTVRHLARAMEDPSLWLSALRQHLALLGDLPKALWDRSPEVRALVRAQVRQRLATLSRDANMLHEIERLGDPELRLELWEASLSHVPVRLRSLPSFLTDDPAFKAIMVVRRDWSALQPLDPAERKALGLRPLTPLERQNLGERFADSLIRHLTPSQRDALWQTVVRQLRADGVQFPFPIDTFAEFAQGLHAHGIDFPERIHSLDTLATIVRDRTPTPGDTRPVLLMLSPKTDFNTAFVSGLQVHGPDGHVLDYYAGRIDALVQHSPFRVVYYESGDEVTDRAMIRQVTGDLRHPVHTLWFAGHGSQSTLQRRESLFDEGAYLDIGDLIDRPDGMADLLARAVTHQVVLDACSNGRGRTDAPNLANAIRMVAAPGVRVLSGVLSSNIETMTVHGDGAIDLAYFQEENAAGDADPDRPLPDHSYVAVAGATDVFDRRWDANLGWHSGAGIVDAAAGYKTRLSLQLSWLHRVGDGMWLGPRLTGYGGWSESDNPERPYAVHNGLSAGVTFQMSRPRLSFEQSLDVGLEAGGPRIRWRWVTRWGQGCTAACGSGHPQHST